MKALLMGSTGLVGRQVLRQLLDEPRYSEVHAILRRAPPGDFPSAPGKLQAHVLDFEKLREAPPALWAVDHIYCCLGTTIRQAGSSEAFRQVDHDYPEIAAQLGAKAGVQKFLLISSVSANSRSRSSYLRVKGETEAAVVRSGIPEVHAYRPSFLLGNRGESRPLERLGIHVFKALAPVLVGPLRLYRPIQASKLAQIMIAKALTTRQDGFGVHEGSHLV